MGDRHNRKRTRHRTSNPARRQHRLEPTPIQPGPLYTPTAGCERTPLQTSVAIRYHQTSSKPHCHKWSTSSSFCVSGEDDKSRDLRIFGGDEADGQQEWMDDLRGPMLDVVFGLFNGVDYEDDDGMHGVMI